jgi:NADH:ubiquinone oxidoreductase subunit 5 (subunit L)/multisubunit Na+/H+ antiporter MnhA subunit
MKLFLKIFFFSLLSCLIIGFYIKTFENSNDGNKIIGFTVLTAAFIFMPIFLVYRWKGKKLKDYTLSKENLEKLRNSYEK